MLLQKNVNILYMQILGYVLIFDLCAIIFLMYLGDDYKRFLQPFTNRRDFIVEWLGAHGVKSVVMPIDGHEHIYVVFPKECYSPVFKIKTVIAHYDIFNGSPGANDNSSSVFAMMNWAVRLLKDGGQHNVRLVFTDGEEIVSGAGGNVCAGAKSGVFSQGAFGLANVFKRLNITDDDVYVFDCVGRGTVPVVAKNVLSKKVPEKFKKKFFALKEQTELVLRSASGGKFVTLPVSYSDNAGFLANGIAAVCVTMLPVEEANKYMYDLMRFPPLEDFVMNHKVADGVQKNELENMLPETWKKLHTRDDNFESLSEESFVLMEKILDCIAALKTICS